MRRAPYELALESRAAGTPSTYRFETADGVHSKRSFRTAELLLAESLWEADPGRLLCPEANYGVVGTVLAAAADAVVMTESSARAAQLCERNARGNGTAATVELLADLQELEGPFDAAAYAPKPYTALPIGKRRIADALSVLRPGGRLYLSGSDRAGLSRYEDCLREVGERVERVATSGDCRLLAATRPATVDPPEYVTPRRFEARVAGVDLGLVSVPGLFSASALDAGTRLLIETAGTGVEDGDRVLDLCCGYGAVGAFAAGAADCDVWLSDDDCVATRCAGCSLDATGVGGRVVTADAADGVAGREFDRVLCYPTTHAGDGVLSELFDGARDVLPPDGRLAVVHHCDLDIDIDIDVDERPGGFDTVDRTTGTEHVVLTLAPS